jgi:hypothetical protein
LLFKRAEILTSSSEECNELIEIFLKAEVVVIEWATDTAPSD